MCGNVPQLADDYYVTHSMHVDMYCMAPQQLSIYFSIVDRWFAKHYRISNIRTKGFLEHLEALLLPVVLEISASSCHYQIATVSSSKHVDRNRARG